MNSPAALAALRQAAGVPAGDLASRVHEAVADYRGGRRVFHLASADEVADLVRLRATVDRTTAVADLQRPGDFQALR